jgi:hypothetical protein
MRSRVSLLLMCGALVAAIACAPAAEPPPAQEAAADPCAGLNTLTDAKNADGWQLLFDGSSMNGWHGYNGGDTEAWLIEDCALKTAGTEDNYGSHSRVDLTTDEEYTNFELAIDWKATTAGNGGLIYAVVEDPKYESAWMTGPEYQLLDDVGWPGELKPAQYSGSDYDMLAASEDKDLKPVGEWNTTKLVVNGAHVEHWLNGGKVVEFERWSDEWKARRDASKWGEHKDYGLAETGRIVLQDHGSEFWFRNIKIREIGADSDDEHSEDGDDSDDGEHTDSDEDNEDGE